MLITPENARVYQTDSVTVNGRKIFITTNPRGFYIIRVEGSGEQPAVFNQLFTNLRDARLLLNKYSLEHQAEYNKKQMIKEVAERHKIKKNG